eukprot:TRINITY_DN728_c0_g1_i2.p1 TRINITY_DN728_c0_g1~~TRINITY_DN728_c0_g1_i2.p1  ORF type:complete len:1060 (-),score=249.55 TRINITY_DN728_c0_g1_i2:81-3260(-)
MYTHTVHHSTVQDKTTPHSVIEAIPTLSFTMSTFAYTPQKLSGLIQGVSDSKDGALPVDFQDVNTLASKLQVNLDQGLATSSDLKGRRNALGSNRIPPPPITSLLQLVWQVLQDFTLIMLIVSACVSLTLGYAFERHESPDTWWIEGAAIIVSVLIVVSVSAGNDYVKELQFQRLNAQVEDVKVAVFRDGEQSEVSTNDILVGDLVDIAVGDILCADGILIKGNDIKTDESALTGETNLIKKSLDKKPLMMSGTKVMEGVGRMMILAVGEYSQAGIIKKLIMTGKTGAVGDAAAAGDSGASNGSPETPLQSKLAQLAVQVGKIGSVLAAFCFVVMTSQYVYTSTEWGHEQWGKILGFFITAVTVLVVAVPEGLPLAVTLSLAFSVRRMQSDNNLVKHLDACETMGNATAICSDKTGTLTTNRMTVMESWLGGERFSPCPANPNKDLTATFQQYLQENIAINSTARIVVSEKDGQKTFEQIGSKTECALLQFGLELGGDYEQTRARVPATKIYAFSSARKRMSTAVKDRVYVKGATEIVLNLCTSVMSPDGKVKPLSAADKKRVGNEVIDAFANNGLRTLCLAYRDLKKGENMDDTDAIESNLTCLCIVGIEDPVRPEVPHAIKQCHSAGIAVRMVTGDNLTTAKSIARKCGILRDDDHDVIALEGPDFRARVLDTKTGKLNQGEIDKIWPKLRVMARSSPTDKFTLVTGMLESKINPDRQVIAVTGDGTNDAPALKKADVGFAMGIAGTSVAKDACDIILLDDNFSSIVLAVKWGRNVYDSIRKFLQFQLTVNMVALVVACLGALVLHESPIRAVQMLWVNLIMDSLASLALATEAPTDALLERKPYGEHTPLISRRMWRFILGHAAYQLVIVLGLIFYGSSLLGIADGRGLPNHAPPTQHYTIIFNVFVLLQVFNEINARKLHGEINVFSGLFNNFLFVCIMIATLVVQAIMVQYGGKFVGCAPLTQPQWTLCIALGASTLVWQFILNLLAPKAIFPKTQGQKGKTSSLLRRDLVRIRAVNRFLAAGQTYRRKELARAITMEKTRQDLDRPLEGKKNK